MEEKKSPFEYGKAAFLAGKVCTPAKDAEFLAAHIQGNNEIGAGLPALKEWLRGWHTANLAAEA